jgi:hypothetical protein
MKDKPKKKKHEHADILQDAIETLELTIRSARRCAYDLRHCADSLSLNRPRSASDSEMAKLFSDRADFFVKLFQSGNAMKDYRHSLYEQISGLEFNLAQLRGILAKHKIADPTSF